MSGPTLGDLSNNRWSGGGISSVKLSHGTILQPLEAQDWKYHKHSGCNFKVISWISPSLGTGEHSIFWIKEWMKTFLYRLTLSEDQAIINWFIFYENFRIHSPRQFSTAMYHEWAVYIARNSRVLTWPEKIQPPHQSHAKSQIASRRGASTPESEEESQIGKIARQWKTLGQSPYIPRFDYFTPIIDYLLRSSDWDIVRAAEEEE